jgi:hypothetical protein
VYLKLTANRFISECTFGKIDFNREETLAVQQLMALIVKGCQMIQKPL